MATDRTLILQTVLIILFVSMRDAGHDATQPLWYLYEALARAMSHCYFYEKCETLLKNQRNLIFICCWVRREGTGLLKIANVSVFLGGSMRNACAEQFHMQWAICSSLSTISWSNMLFYKRAEQRLVALKRQKDAHDYSKPAMTSYTAKRSCFLQMWKCWTWALLPIGLE